MKLEYDELIKIYKKASLCRSFEEKVFKLVNEKIINIPVYLSAGQEYISATISTALDRLGVGERQIFIQHRGHSIYLNFGGDIDELILELLGRDSGCSNGKGGSASIQSKKANIYGHDGLMGSHGPIATGMCYANKMPTLCFTGDAAGEEDYFLTSMGWASTKELPIWYLIEDNNYSILTEKKIRRNWEISDVASGFKLLSYNIQDDPSEIYSVIPNEFIKPLVINFRTNRLFWHAGAGIDDPNVFDRHKVVAKKIGATISDQINIESKEIVEEAWKKYI